jgi:Pheromone A receptor
MYRTWTRGREVKSILGTSTGSPDYNYNHYIRLFILSGIDMAIIAAIPFNIWHFTTYFQVPILPWPGWKAIHSNWSQIPTLTTAYLRSTHGIGMFYQFEINRWMSVVYGYLFFLFFGVTAEARKRYASAWQYASKIFCWRIGLSRERSRYVLGLVLFQPISSQIVDLQPWSRRSPRPCNVRMSFAENQHPAHSDKSEYSYGTSGIITVPSTAAFIAGFSKQETESQFAPSRELINPSPISRKYKITRIPPPTAPSDLELEFAVQPFVSKDSEGGLKV